MKQFIKTILLTAFALVAMPVMAHAQSFNNDSQDFATVLVANDTVNGCNAGPGVGCWTSTVAANPGDTIAVQIYYHNTGTASASNVYLTLSPQSTALASSATFSGSVKVNSTAVANGSASVTFPNGQQTLTLIPGSVKWFPNQADFGQSVSGESRLFTSTGIPIGDVKPGWGDQGTMAASFRVSNNGIINPPVYNDCTLNLSANQSSVYSGDPVTLSWYSNNCTSLSITPTVGSVATSGSTVVRPYGQTTYTLIGYSANGSSQQSSVTIYTNSNNPYIPPVNNTCSIYSFTPDKTYITRNENTVLRWNTNASYVTISPLGINYGAASSSTPVGPSTTTTYYMTAYCTNGYSTSATTTISVANAVTSNMQVTTTNATSLRTGSAQLNGITAPNNNGTATAWFEYGLTGSLGSRSTAQSVATANNSYFNDYVTGLAPNTWYYYRAVLQNNSGTVYGDIVRFKTLGGPVDTTYVPPVRTIKTVQIINNTVTAQSAPSLLELKVNSQYDRMCVNGDMQYVVTYRNISGVTLKDTVLRITHPKELTFIASTQGHYEVVDRVVTVDVGDVAPNQSGIVTLTFRVNSEAVRGALAVTTATVVYTNPNTRAQEDATAYSLINVSDDCPTLNNLQGNAFGTGFLPHTLLEWLLLILVILGLIILARQLYKKSHQQA